MPFISDSQLNNLQTYIQKQKDRLKSVSVKQKAAEKASELKSTAECVGAAAVIGFIRGKREDSQGVWNAPFVKFDMELLVGLSFAGLALFDVMGKYDEDALNMGNGILSHYAGQVARKMAKTGHFSQVAGSVSGRHQLVAGHPSFIGRDPVAAALANSGI